MKLKLLTLGIVLLLFAFAPSASAATISFSIGQTDCPNNSCFGGIYMVSYDPTVLTGVGYLVTFIANTTDYTGADTNYIHSVAVKVSNQLAGGSLEAAPINDGYWVFSANSTVNAGGCSTKGGGGFGCAEFSSSNLGVQVGGLATWEFYLKLGPGDTFIDQASLKVLFVDGTGQQAGVMSEHAAAVPEPASMLLLGTGLIGLGLVARRKK